MTSFKSDFRDNGMTGAHSFTASPARRRRLGHMLGSTGLGGFGGLAALAMAAPVAAQVVIPGFTCTADGLCSINAAGTNGASRDPNSGDGNGGRGDDGSSGTDTASKIPDSTSWTSTTAGGPVPTVIVNAAGGGGGKGGAANNNGDGYNGGLGGDGKDAGKISLTIGASSAIRNGGGGSVVHLYSTGGFGGAGGQEDNKGTAGSPGVAGNGNQIIFTLNPGATLTGSASGVGAVILEADGGHGGDAGNGTTKTSTSNAPAGTAGGTAGTIQATIDGTIVSGGSGIVAHANGGEGGKGGSAGSVLGDGNGGKGGVGGQGAKVALTLDGASVTAKGAAGSGTGGQANVDNFSQDGTVSASISVMSAAASATSQGGNGAYGSGANGGTSAHAGDGGAGGNGDVAYIEASGGTITSTDYGAMGLVAISQGASGGNGGSSGAVFSRSGGVGGPAGDSLQAQVNVSNGTVITTNGRYGDGVLALAVGGGGGIGGDVNGGGAGMSFAFGGMGGEGGQGGVALATNGAWTADGSNWDYSAGGVISTTGDHALGMAALSVGGGGGRGGDAVNATLGVLTYSIGGSGSSGGKGDHAWVQNTGVVQTTGNHSIGLAASSIGGGGGNGGAAHSYEVGQGFTAAVAVGGNAGGCNTLGCALGDGADIMNYGQVITMGADSYALMAQSIGGGGGIGGASVANNLDTGTPSEDDLPTLKLTASIGGNGGSGADAGVVNILNAGMAITQGIGASGILAQSIGGGGGAGGDSEATTNSLAPSGISITTAVGGTGGTAGDGNSVTVANSGLVWTLNDQSSGILAQSVGGGGGSGGFGGANTGSYMKDEGGTMTVDISVGGAGGAGGIGGTVTVSNYVDSTFVDSLGNKAAPSGYGTGGIVTLGNASDGIFAQSVGGGGGNGGNSTADGGGGTVTLNLHFGGSGGGGGDGGAVTVDNGMGTIHTYGGNSAGIFAQSVGGGGGRGGTGADNGAADPNYTVNTLMQQGLGLNGNVTKVADDVYAWAGTIANAFNQPSTLTGMVNSYIENNKPEELEDPAESDSTLSLELGAGWDGNGGAAGKGGNVEVDNQSEIDTNGPLSPGIFAQSVGGGGGLAGATNSSMDSIAANESSISATMTFGGKDGLSGAGGNVTINAVSATSLITTQGDVSPGILAQSVGGGGGNGAVTIVGAALPDKNGQVGFISLGAQKGGSTNWDDLFAGTVDVQAEFIRTNGDDSPGILAQTVGGGGGISVVLSADYNADTGGWVSQTGNPDPSKTVGWQFNGTAPENSYGGDVTVTLADNGNITTHGRNSYGILAQSISDGGGIIISDYWLPNGGFVGTNGVNNNAAAVSVVTNAGSSIVTTGAGAVGILAQSIAGGGLVGGMDGAALRISYQGGASTSWGGSVNVTNHADITTTGAFAHGIFAQVGARAGVIGATTETPSGFLFTGSSNSSCGDACGDHGEVNIDLLGGTVHVSGANAYGVVMISQSNPASTGNVFLHVGNGAAILADKDSLGAVFLGGANNNNVVIDQGGNVDGYSSANRLAFASWDQTMTDQGSGPDAANILLNGYVGGGALLGNGSTINIGTTGTMAFGDTVNLGTGGAVNNGGMVEVGPVGMINTTTLTGNFKQVAGGTTLFDVDLANGQADRLELATGSATIAGSIASNLINVQAGSVVVMTTRQGTITLDPSVQWTTTSAYEFKPVLSVDNTVLSIQATADFTNVEGGLNKAQSKVASHLQEIWDSGAQIGEKGFTALAKINDQATYSRALDTLTGQAVGAIAAARFASSFGFVNNMQSCPQFEEGGMMQRERACAWLRGTAGTATQDARDGSYGYQANGETMQVGMQIEVASDWFLGVSGAYEKSRFYGDAGTARITGDGVMFGMSLKRQAGDWLFSGALDGGLGNYTSVRQIEVGDVKDTANASPKSWHLGGTLRVGRQFAFRDFYLRPSAELRVVHVGADGYKETGGSDFNLRLASASNTTFVGTGALEAGTQTDIGHGARLGFFGSVGLSVLSDDSWDATAHFVDAPANSAGFTASTPLPDLLGRFTAGASLYTAGKVELRVQYNAEVGKDFHAQAGMARLAIKF